MVLGPTSTTPVAVKYEAGAPTEFLPAHAAVLNPDDKSVDFFAPFAAGDEIVLMDAGDGPASGFRGPLNAAYDAAVADLGGAAPKAGVLLYCGGMGIAVGDNL